jgi:hypothetical protein
MLVSETRRIPLGVYRGLRYGMVLHPQFSPDAYLEGMATRKTLLRNHGPRAVLNALENLVGGYGPECSTVQQELSIVESQLRDYKARLGSPFCHDSYLTELTALRDQLKAGLSGGTPEPNSEALPDVAQLAERIKALKASNTIEAAPERVERRRHAGETPVTARIRKRAEAITELHSENEPKKTDLCVDHSTPAEIAPVFPSDQLVGSELFPGDASAKQLAEKDDAETYRERIARFPRRLSRQASLF